MPEVSTPQSYTAEGKENKEWGNFMVNPNTPLDCTHAVETPDLALQRDLDPHLVEHVSQVVFRVNPGGHRITEEDEILKKHTRRRFEKQNNLRVSFGFSEGSDDVSPAPHLQGSHQSSCKSHGRPSLSPRCLGCSSETYTCRVKLPVSSR